MKQNKKMQVKKETYKQKNIKTKLKTIKLNKNNQNKMQHTKN